MRAGASLFLVAGIGVADEKKNESDSSEAESKTEGDREKVVEPVSFESDIRPIFEKRCVHCHNRKTMPDRVSFERAKFAFAPSADGKVYIVRGKPEASLLVAAIEAPMFHEKEMPIVGERLNDEERALMRRWVAEGAVWPKGKPGKVKVTFRAKE